MASIYSWFSRLYGGDLYLWLAGCDPFGSRIGTDYLTLIGIVVIAITTLVCLVWYFLPVARFNKCRDWAIMLFSTSAICLFVGCGWVYNLWSQMPQWVLYGVANVTGDGVNVPYVPNPGAVLTVTPLSFWQFGFVNMIISLVVFFVLSVVVAPMNKQRRGVPFNVVRLFKR